MHVLDLHENGYIKPHVDAVRFCGNTIAGSYISVIFKQKINMAIFLFRYMSLKWCCNETYKWKR